jgi:hypothetical protein
VPTACEVVANVESLETHGLDEFHSGWDVFYFVCIKLFLPISQSLSCSHEMTHRICFSLAFCQIFLVSVLVTP